MKFGASIALCLLLAFTVTSQTQTRLIDLRVDHFNPLDRRSFGARYFINQQDWFSGGPIFIFVPSGFALWARQKYPNLVDEVWASSAPINAVFEYPQFMPNTYNVFNNIGGPECGQILTGAFRFIEESIRTGNTSYVHDRLRLCTPIEVEIEEELSMLFYGFSNSLGSGFVANARYPDVEAACNIMLGVDSPDDPAENDLDAFARWYIDVYRHSDQLNCPTNSYLGSYQNTS